MDAITEFIKGIFNEWLINHIKGILIGCLAFGGAWFLGHWGMAHYVSIYNAVAVISKVWDVLGVADGLFLVVALVNYGVQWIRKLSRPY